MPPIVRRATLADADVIVEYNRRLAVESEGVTLDPAVLAAGVAAGLADAEKALYFVAQESAAIVGQLMITREWSDWRNGWIWWIQSVYVREDARRRGVFRALYQHALEAAKAERDVVGLRLYVVHENAAAQATYRRLGMEATEYIVLEKCPL